jgi:hypothetical protein
MTYYAPELLDRVLFQVVSGVGPERLGPVLGSRPVAALVAGGTAVDFSKFRQPYLFDLPLIPFPRAVILGVKRPYNDSQKGQAEDSVNHQLVFC